MGIVVMVGYGGVESRFRWNDWSGECVRDRSGYPAATEGRHCARAVARSNSG
ncbi:hypothetical protein AB406_1496 [Riemerella anatipestifer]|uniref:Uncharacterized protein n=1 Tax=Riemerella anatipestifer TaxID=34085 RepID=A0A1S7DTQ5_RIEAN|nr:hypothetical protein AB406_1496 [Riemerella anatipestifer]